MDTSLEPPRELSAHSVRLAQAARAIAPAMDHLVTAKTLVGSGQATVMLELRGGAVRIKRRGMPDMYLPLEMAEEIGRFLVAAGQAARTTTSAAATAAATA